MIRKNSPDQILSYLEDTSNFKKGNADEVVFPSNENEVAEIVKEYSSKNKPLTPSGAGTGTTAGRIPLEGGILATDNLNKILEINQEKKTTTVQPGVRVETLLNELSNYGLFYLAWPTEKLSCIGGNTSTNASGEYSFRYGSIRKYITRLTVVLSTGEKLKINRGKVFATKEGIINFNNYQFRIPSYTSPNIKNSAGYFSRPGMDLIDLFIGSEGTLGIITEIELKITDKLSPSFSLIVFFRQESDYFNFFKEVKQNAENSNKFINPLCLESFDKNSLDFLRSKYPNIPSESSGAIFVEQEFPGDTEQVLEKWNELAEKYNPLDVWFAETNSAREKFMDFRYKLPESINEFFRKIKIQKISLDIAVPDENFDELIGFYKNKLSGKDLHYVLFGHIGDNHLHFNLFPKNDTEKEQSENIYVECVKKAVSLGGTISAEHGVGKLKHKYLEMMYGKDGIKEMVRIKKFLDPHSILAQNNIFPKKYLF